MKICMVGLGSIGRRHLINLVKVLTEKKLTFQIDALRSEKKVDVAEVNKWITKIFYKVEDIPEDYDIVFVTNPTSMHYQSIISMLSKTQHMFIEKPVFDSIKYNLDDIFLKKESIYYVACPLRYSPVIQHVKKIIKTEKIYSVRAICSSFLPDWRKDVDYRKVYSAKKQLGGGVSLDLIHEWDYLVYLFGFPDEISCFQGKFSSLEIDSEDLAVYIAKYQDKLVEVHLDYFGRSTERKLELYCKEYKIIADILNNRIEYIGNDDKIIEFLHEDIYVNEIHYFLDIIDGREVNNNSVEHALKVLNYATR